MKKRLIATLLIFSLCLISFYLIDIGISNHARSWYAQWKITDLLEGDTDTVYSINYKNDNNTADYAKNMRLLMEYIQSIDEVESAGQYFYSTVSFEELKNNKEFLTINEPIMQSNHTFSTNDFSLSTGLYVDWSIKNLCGIQLLEGNWDTTPPPNTYPIIIGNAFEDVIPVGTILTMEEHPISFQVIGVLQKQSEWLPFGDLFTVGGELDLDGMFIVDINALSQNEDIFYYLLPTAAHTSFMTGNNINRTVISQIQEKAKELNLGINIQSVSSLIKSYQDENRSTFNLATLVYGLIVFLAAMSISASSVVGVLMRKSEYGVMYACGVNTKDIIWTLIAENGLIISIAAILTFLFRTYLIFSNQDIFYKQTVMIHNQIVPAFLLGIVIVITLLSIFAPITVLKKMRPVELIGGTES